MKKLSLCLLLSVFSLNSMVEMITDIQPQLLTLAAKKQSPVGMYYVARINIASKDKTKQKIGINYLTQLSEQYDMLNAQADLGALYLKGQIVGKDTNKAKVLFEQAKAQGCIVGKTFADELDVHHMSAERGYAILSTASTNIGVPPLIINN